jgi:hypothetical protein
MKKYFLTSVTILVASLFLFLNYGSGESSNSSTSKPSCEYAGTLEEVKSCITGVWVANTTGKIWYRVVIKSDLTYQLYNAMPADGAWPSSPEKTGTVTIDEGRFTNSGKKYVYAQLNNSSGFGDYNILFDGSISSLCLGTKTVCIIRKGDENPWK